MKNTDIKKALQEAQRFIDAVHDLNAAESLARLERERLMKQEGPGAGLRVHSPLDGSPESATVRRASMDLTRALAKMRNA